jgi:hypothetical protein
MLSHRKQGPVLPTLVLTISDKDRKRRSSRAAGLISSKDSASTTIWFRTPPDNNYPSLHDWARCILSKKGVMSPDSPVSPHFPSPSARREAPDTYTRPSSGNASSRLDGRPLLHKSSTATYSTGVRERPLTFSSESPSLKSKRSDLSSPSSSNYPIQQFAYSTQSYSGTLPSDLPSPTTTADYQGEFIEGWTSAQGRSSIVSSPVHGRDSISSQAIHAPLGDFSSSPSHRETILDRAFQMRFIPGSEREIPGEEKLSSLARFEALMREADARRRPREAIESVTGLEMRSAFDADDSSDEAQAEEDTDSDRDSFVHEQDALQSPSFMSPSAQRALDFITSRHEADEPPVSPTSPTVPMSPRPSYARNHLSFHADAVYQRSTITPARPHTAHGKSRTSQGQSNKPPQQPAPMASTQESQIANHRLSEYTYRQAHVSDKRQSRSSSKRSSFTEFTKRLSSTSSLLLVQTNVSGGSSRPGSEVDIPSSLGRTGLNARGAGPPPRDREDQEKRCGWRGSVGVIGTEGGFL